MILLDTNIVSFLFKEDTRLFYYKQYLEHQIWSMSMMTVAELYLWSRVHHWGPQRIKQLEIWITDKFKILGFDWQTCQLWGEVVAECRSKGRPISAQDAWIAATALQYGLPLVTHNPSDFEPIQTLNIITAMN